MAYIYFRHIRLHSAVFTLLCFLGQAAFGQPEIDVLRLRVAGTDVVLHQEDGCFAGDSFVLSANLDSVRFALGAHGMHEDVRHPDETTVSGNGRVIEHHKESHVFVFTHPDENRRYDALQLRKVADEVDGQPLWCVRPNPQGAAPAPSCLKAADEPWTLFTHGLAHVSFVKPTGDGRHDAAAIMRVNLRHAATELEPAWTTDRAPNRCFAPSDAREVPLTVNEVADSVVWHSAVHGKRLALTFDACSTYSYGPFNPEVIAALTAEDVPATLFVGGHWAEMHPDALRTLAQNPLFEIGNHTYSHPHMRDLEPWQQAQELRWTQALVYNLTGVTPRMFRPPYGEVDDVMLQEVAKAGLFTVEYDLPAGDADVHVSPMKLTQWVVGQAQQGSIVIMHMNRPKNHTAQALPMIVRELRAKGFTFCRMSDLLHDGGVQCR